MTNRVTTLSECVQPQSTVPRTNLMNQSTIYRRHEARLARSYALRDDPRPAFVRVLSGLPGFRMIIPPYHSNAERGQKKYGSSEKINRKHEIGSFSEETLFVPFAAIGHDVVGHAEPKERQMQNVNLQTMQAMLATGFCSGVGECIFAYRTNLNNVKYSLRNSNEIGPVRMNTFSNGGNPSWLFFLHDSSKGFRPANFHVPKEPTFHSVKPRGNDMPGSQSMISRLSTGTVRNAFSVSCRTSLLFGTKVYVDSYIRTQQIRNITTDAGNSFSDKVCIASSSIAGGVVGLGRAAVMQIQLRQKQFSRSTNSTIQQLESGRASAQRLVGRDILASICYFSTYEAVSSILSPSKTSLCSERCGKKEIFPIVTGGALAGVAQVAAVNFHRYAIYGSTIWWTRIMLPAASRAGPIHALIFYGYEKMMEGTSI